MDSTDSDAAARPPKRPLKSSISLNLKDHIGEGLGLSGAQRPLSPNNYQFLLRRASAVIEEQMEEAILAIGSASTPIQFRDAVKSGLFFSLHNVKDSVVFLVNPDNNELVRYETNTSYSPLLKSGVLWEVVRRRAATIVKPSDTIAETDPIRKLMKDYKPLEGDQVVLINPIVRKKDNEVIALMTVICSEPSVAQVEKLRWLERNVLVAAARVLNCVTVERNRMRAEGMLDVCSDLIDLDTTSLSIKILKHIKSTLDVKMSFLFLISECTQELVCPARNDSALEKEIRIELNSESIYGRCFMNGEFLLLDNVPEDARFNPITDKVNNYEPSSMMCLPIKIHQVEKAHVLLQQTVGVAVVCDKTNGKPFTHRDQDNLEFVIRFSSSVIANTLAFQRELMLKKQNQALLLMAKNLFSQLNDINTLFSEIMNEARNLTKAERCSLFLLDKERQELVATVFDSDLPSEDTIKVKVGQGIAGHVAETGKLVNIKDAYKHPQFFKKIDENTGFRTRNMLCFPIKDHQQQVVGVAELCNKIGANYFTTYDEELATTFSVYCGISLYQSQLYQKIAETQGRSKLATELMLYHMQVFSEEVDKLAVAPIPLCSSFHADFSEFSYSPRSLPPDTDSIMAVLSMMNEMELLKRCRIQRNYLAKFLLMVKKGYRDPPYHNWFHALSVTHFCYLMHCHCDLYSVLSELEVFALFVSCLCHDIDHRGTNNAFQLSSNSTLASLYSSVGSVMERHHFAQTVSILNSEGCNIFENLSHENYRLMLDLIRHNILSTDLAHHIRIMSNIKDIAKEGYQSTKPEHHQHMCSLLMTSSDLSSMSKEWAWSQQIADLIYEEFFTQGDLEKALGHTPSEMMDRNKAYVPEQQLGFINGIAGPAYELLAKLLPKAAQAYENLQDNKRRWEHTAKEGRRGSE